MNRNDDLRGIRSGRFQWGSYGFMAGIVVGILMGWLLAGFVGAFLRIALVALAVVPIVLIYLAWRKVVAPWLRPPTEHRYQYVGPANAIETRAVVHGVVREPRTR
jgi:membrane protein implicated in regulation of membrane protease activity